MKYYYLNRVTIKNWKGIKDLTIRPGTKKNVYIMGANEAGKTTFKDAFSWLLSDKDSRDQSTFKIYPNWYEKSPRNNEKDWPLVEAELVSVIDGEPQDKLKLKKQFAERWTKPQGETRYTYKGDTTNYYINEKEVKATEYDAYLEENLADPEVLQMLTNPFFFGDELHWQKRREIITDMIETPDISQAFKSTEMPELHEDVGDDITGWIKSQEKKMREIDKELDSINYHAQLSNIEEVNDEDIEEIEKEISMLKNELTDLRNERATKKAGGNKNELQSQINMVKNEIQSIKSKHESKIEKKLSELEVEKAKYKMQLSNNKEKKTKIKDELERLKEEKQELVKDYKEWEKAKLEKCPECGAAKEDMDPEKVEDFNNRKAKKLKEIKEDGTKKVRRIKEIEENILPVIEEDFVNIIEKKTNVGEKISRYEKKKGEFTDNEEYQELIERKQKLEDELKTVNKEVETPELDDQIEKAEKKLDDLQDQKAELKSKQTKLEDFQEVQEREKELQEDYKELARKVSAAKEAETNYYKIVEEKANELFSLAKVKLFEKQKNGKINDICEIYHDGDNFSTNLNRGHRIRVGIDIINRLSSYYGLTLPLILDNSESVTTKVPTVGQRFYLRVILEKVGWKREDEFDKIVEATGKTPMFIKYKGAN